tara:strand:- start:282 stop:446 length:165 start_codon:yes stop_codon:yes gene_type:complete
VSTIADLERALKQDILTIVSLITRCFAGHGLSGCICQFAVCTLSMHHQVARVSL